MGISAAIVGSAVVGSAIAADAASSAADTQAEATGNAAALERQTAKENLALQKQQYEEGVARQQPYYEAGKSALARLQAGIAPGGEFTKQFGGIMDDPSYQWRLQQGQRALEASAAAKGQLFTAGQQQALQGYGQNMASTEYGNAYQRFIDERQRQLQNTSALAGVGSSTAQGLANLGANYANTASQTAMNSAQNISGYLTSGAAAQAAGQIGQANAWTGGINNAVGSYANQQMMNRLMGSNAAAPAAASTPWAGNSYSATAFA